MPTVNLKSTGINKKRVHFSYENKNTQLTRGNCVFELIF